MPVSTQFPSIPFIDKKVGEPITSFLNISYERWNDAIVCYRTGNYLAAVYLAGYSVECILKYIILQYKFPHLDQVVLNDIAKADMKKVASHYLDSLLDIGNRESIFKVPTKIDYPDIIKWSSEWRYSYYQLDKNSAEYFLKSVISLIRALKDNISNNSIRIRELSPI